MSDRVCPVRRGLRKPTALSLPTVTANERETAWWTLHDVVPVGWRIGELTFDAETERYEFAVISPRPHGHGKPRSASWSGAVSTNSRP
jgi:hypothetical protein